MADTKAGVADAPADLAAEDEVCPHCGAVLDLQRALDAGHPVRSGRKPRDAG